MIMGWFARRRAFVCGMVERWGAICVWFNFAVDFFLLLI